LATQSPALSAPVPYTTLFRSADASLKNTVATDLGTSGIGGNLVVTETTAGSLTQSGVLTVAGTSSFTNSFSTGTINLATQSNALDRKGTLRKSSDEPNAYVKN